MSCLNVDDDDAHEHVLDVARLESHTQRKGSPRGRSTACKHLEYRYLLCAGAAAKGKNRDASGQCEESRKDCIFGSRTQSLSLGGPSIAEVPL
jgi:hypothetical protein